MHGATAVPGHHPPCARLAEITASSVLMGLSFTTAAPYKRGRHLHFTETGSEVADVAHRAQSPQASSYVLLDGHEARPPGASGSARSVSRTLRVSGSHVLRALHAHLAASLALWPPRRPAVGAASTVLRSPSQREARAHGAGVHLTMQKSDRGDSVRHSNRRPRQQTPPAFPGPPARRTPQAPRGRWSSSRRVEDVLRHLCVSIKIPI